MRHHIIPQLHLGHQNTVCWFWPSCVRSSAPGCLRWSSGVAFKSPEGFKRLESLALEKAVGLSESNGAV